MATQVESNGKGLGLNLTRKDFQSDQTVRWCPGCGDYAILAQMQKVLPSLGVPREKFVFISGIGCAARFPYYMNTYGFHTIHGRAPALATGVKVTNPELSVWVISGDGDALSIGGNHLIHAMRRNVGLKIILFNNRIYGLTKGQYSPTSQFGARTKSSPLGSVDYPLHPLTLALGAECSFIARTVDRDQKHMAAVFAEVAKHEGTAIVEVLQNCIVFNDGSWHQYSEKGLKERNVIYLEEGKPLLFGPEGDRKGISLKDMTPKVVAEDSPDVAVHREDDAQGGHAYMLTRMELEGGPMPLGILRRVCRDPYEQMVGRQVKEARAKVDGDLDALLQSGDVWEHK